MSIERQLEQARYAARVKETVDNMVKDRNDFMKYDLPLNKDFEPVNELPPQLSSLKGPIMAALSRVTYESEMFYSYLFNHNLVNEFYQNMHRFLSKGIYNKVNLPASELIQYFTEYITGISEQPANVPGTTSEQIEILREKRRENNRNALLTNDLNALYEHLKTVSNINEMTDTYSKIAEIYDNKLKHQRLLNKSTLEGLTKEERNNKLINKLVKNEEDMRKLLNYYQSADINTIHNLSENIRKKAEANVKIMQLLTDEAKQRSIIQHEEEELVKEALITNRNAERKIIEKAQQEMNLLSKEIDELNSNIEKLSKTSTTKAQKEDLKELKNKLTSKIDRYERLRRSIPL